MELYPTLRDISANLLAVVWLLSVFVGFPVALIYRTLVPSQKQDLVARGADFLFVAATGGLIVLAFTLSTLALLIAVLIYWCLT